MNYEQTKTITSTVREGVTFTIRLLGESLRGRVELETLDARTEQSVLALQDMDLQEQVDAILPLDDVTLPDVGLVPCEQVEYLTPEKKLEWVIATAQQKADAAKGLSSAQRSLLRGIETKQVLTREKFSYISKVKIQPAWIRAGLVSITGIEVNEKPLDTEHLIEFGPRSLSEEIFDAIYRESHLSDADAKNLQSPSSFGGVEDGATKNGTAPNANIGNSGNTKGETAVATSLNP